MNYFIQGFLIGLAYLAPIGMQNLYVINSAATFSKFKAFQVVAATVFFDISLAFAAFFGMGFVIEKYFLARMIFMLVGAVVVMGIGVSLVRAKVSVQDANVKPVPFLKIVATCFAVTWLNPQALIDGTLLLGGFRASLTGASQNYFIIGASSASIAWFSIIAIIAHNLKQFFNAKVLKIINIICGVLLIVFAAKLGYSFIISLINRK